MLTMVDDKRMGFALGAAEYFDQAHRSRSACMTVLRSISQPASHASRAGGGGRRQHARLLQPHTGEGRLAGDGGGERASGPGETGRSAPPGLILLDLMMPEMDGFEFMDALRQREQGNHAPVIVITAKDLTAADRQRLQGGVERIIEKGATSQAEVLAIVRSLLARKTINEA